MKSFCSFSGLLVLSVSIAAISCVQISDPASIDGGPDHSTHSANTATGEADDIDGTVSLSVTTESIGGSFAPKNIAALWVEDSDGLFVKTLGAWAATRKKYLYSWKDSQGSTDGTTGATRPNHATVLSVSWDGTDDEGRSMEAGQYLIRGELTDRNGAGETFSVGIDLTGGVDIPSQSAPAEAGFPAIAYGYEVP